jgi:putative ABC transport system permease protein
VNIQVSELNRLPETIENLELLPDVQAVTVAQVMGTIRNLMQTGENVLLMVMLLALIIGGLGTMNTMLMTVFERTREIGLMKAIGASNGQVFNLFITEGMAICFAGSILGVSTGSLVALAGNSVLKFFVPVMPSQPVGQLSLSAAVVSIAFPVLLGALATLYPAFRAAGLDPVQSLKNE